MSIKAIRFRSEGSLVVLQVQEEKADNYLSHKSQISWRDAQVEDLLEVARLMIAPAQDEVAIYPRAASL